MEKTLKEVLNGQEKDYIIPFFWQNGAEDAVILQEMEKIYEAGIRQVCVESRVHPDFLGPGWWEDMDVILEEAGKRGMKVWVLDDAHFPTGYVNGRVPEHPEFGKRYLACYHIDVRGPLSGHGFLMHLEAGEEFIGVTVGKKGRESQVLSKVCDVTDKVRDGVLYWEVPEGAWTITVLKITSRGTGRRGYLNVIDKKAVEFFIQTVYEPHFERYHDRFGKEFGGFFSDEPEIGNVLSEYGHNARLGNMGQTLPWCEELGELLRQSWGESMTIRLTALWDDVGEMTQSARFSYMDAVTDLYGRCFSGQIGDWCREHGVEYIGHVIEDNGCHGRLGLGTGHFFKAVGGQDMSGIDVVLQQIRPGFDDCWFYHTHGKGQYNGTFFHYGLAKMGVSLAHLDRKKKGRTMCEIFGAYGWAEGLKLMKWLADHMLVRGVNYFVPHAFSMKDFPDRDCPPHFYARGRNPQFPYFSYLMAYMNRVSHLISGGVHVPAAAVFYPVCAEWMGECDGFEVVGRELLQHQADYEVLPEEALLGGSIRQGRLRAGEESYDTVIFPYCEYLPDQILQWCDKALEEGVRVIFHKKRPKYMNTHESYTHKGLILAEDLARVIREEGIGEIRFAQENPYLRYYHYRQSEGDYILLFHEGVEDGGGGEQNQMLCLPPELARRSVFWYDAWENRLYQAENRDGMVSVPLGPGEAAILFAGEIEMGMEARPMRRDWKELYSFEGPWKVKMKEYTGEKEWETKLSELENLTGADGLPYFSGEMEYEAEFEGGRLPQGVSEFRLDCGRVYETMEVLLNGRSLGVRLTAPYTVEFAGEDVLPGRNVVKIRVCNTLVHAVRDGLSSTMPVEPSGLLGPVRLLG